MKLKSLTAKLAALLCACGFAFSAQAATIQVSNAQELTDAVSTANAGDTIQLTGNISYTTTISLAFGKSNVYSLAIQKSLTIDGQGQYKITSSATRGIGIGGDGIKIDVTFKDITIETTYNNSNGNIIETRGNIGTLTLDHATLTHVNDLWWCGAVQIGGNQADKANVVIKDSTIDPGREGYPVVTWNPVNLTVTDSTLIGYCATYMKGINGSTGSGGSVVNISNSVITATNPTSNYSFGVFSFEYQGGGNNNTTINLVDSTLTIDATGGGAGYILHLKDSVSNMSGNTVNIAQGNKIYGNGYSLIKNGGVVNLSAGVLVGGDEDGLTYIRNLVTSDLYGYNIGEEAVVVGDRTYYPLERPMVAQIGEIKYETLPAAVEAAKAGDTVKLLSDVTLSATLEITKSITLDLSGHMLTKALTSTTDRTPVIKALSGTVEIKNGSISYDLSTYKGTTGAYYANVFYVGMNMSNSVYSYGDCNLTLNGVSVSETFPKGKSLAMIYVESGSLVVVDSTLSASNIAGNTSAQYVIYTTTHNSAQVNANVLLKGETVIDTNGKSGIHAIWLQNASDTLVISGDNVTIDADAEWKTSSWSSTLSYAYAVNCQYGSCAIEGGKFAGRVYQNYGTITVSGGIYDHDLSNTTSTTKNRFAVASGYVFTANTDPATAETYPYVVKIPSVAKIGNTEYPTLAAAILAAQSGDTIEILDGTWGADAVGTMTTSESLSVRAKSLTIQAAEGATPKFTSNVYFGYDDNHTANATMTVTGLAFENAQLSLVNYVQATVEDCAFVGSGASAALYVGDSCDKTPLTSGDYLGNQVTIRNCTFNGTASGAPAVRVRNSGNVLISGNSIVNAAHNGILLESNDALDKAPVKTVVVQNNTITEWNAGNVADGGRGIRADLGTLAEGSTVTISGNTFRKETTGLDSPDFAKITGAGSATVDLSGNDWNDMLLSEVAGNSAVYFCNVTPTLTSVITTKKEPVAQIGETKYATLAAAVAAAQDGATTKTTITLLADIALDNTVEIEWPKPASGSGLFIDLNNHNITATDCRALWIKTGYVTLKGHGTISSVATENSSFSKDSSVIRVGSTESQAQAAATLDMKEDVTVSTTHCYGITVFGNNTGSNGLTLKCLGTVTTKDRPAIAGNGTSTLSSTSITIDNGATVSATSEYAIYHPQAGALSIKGTVTGLGGIEMKAGTLTIDSTGIITATGTASHPGVNNNGASTSGYALVLVENSGYKGVATAKISKGAINGTIGIIADDDVDSSKKATLAVSGGSFSLAVPNAYCADGYEPTSADSNDRYTVQVAAASAVAKITRDNVITYYLTVLDAVNAAQNGETVTMIADFSKSYPAGGLINVAAGKSVTLDLNNHSIINLSDTRGYVASLANGSSTLTLKGTGSIQGYNAVNVTGRGTKVIIDGNITVTGTEACFRISGNSVANPGVEIKNGTFHGGSLGVFYKVSLKDNITIAITGGIYNIEPDEAFIADGYVAVGNADEATKDVYPWMVGRAVAQIGETTYGSLAEAVAAAQNGETITMLADVDIGTTGLVIAEGKNFTLDIGTYNIIGTVNGKLITNNGTIVVNGTTGCIYNQDISAQGHDAFLNNGTATINGGWFGDADNDKTNANAINRGAGFRNFGTATINGGHFTACDNYTNGGYAYAIINGNDSNNPTLTINNADVYGKNNGNIANNSGSVTVKDGTFDVSGSQSYYSVYSYSGNTVVEGGTFTKSGNSNGQFCVEVDNDNANNPGSIAVSGGYFTEPVIAKYCAEGVLPCTTPDEDTGLYTVRAANYVAQIVGGAKFESLQAAFDAVADGETITMLANSTESGEPVLARDISVTLDLNGKTVTANDDIWVKTGSLMVVGSKGSAINSTGYAFYVSTQSIANNVATLTINSNDVTIHGDDYGIAVMSGGVVNLQAGSVTSTANAAICNNGSNKANTTINITGGTVSSDSTAIYHPGPGTLIVGLSSCDGDDGHSHPVIAGKTGVEMRAGTLNVYCGDITATATEFAENANGSGPTIAGAAIAVSQHTTDKPISVAISGGTLNGIYGVYEKDLQNPTTGAEVSINVTGGTISGTTHAIVIADIDSTTETVRAAVSGGYFSDRNLEGYLVEGKLCTTKLASNGLYAVVDADTVTFANGDNSLEVLLPASFTYPSGDLAEIALSLPTYTATDTTFAGWKIGGEGDAIAALPAGTKGNVTLVATWETVRTISVDTSATPEQTVLNNIKVTESWIESNANLTSESSNEAIKEELEKPASNGLKVWENYVLGQDPTTKVEVESEQGASETAMPVKNTLAVQPVDTGFKVKYSLDKVDTTGAVVENGEGAKQDTSDLELNLKEATSDDSNVAYYKMTATIQKTTGETVSTVHSENTIGVLAVKEAPATAIIGVPWSSSTDSKSISVNDLVRTANLTPGDEMKVYDPTTKTYKMWELNKDKEWEPVNTSSGSGTSNPGEADVNTVARGAGVWLTRKNPDEPIYLVGQATAEAEVATPLEKPAEGKQTWNLVAPPSVNPVNIADLLNSTEATDKVLVPTASVPKNIVKMGGKWGYIAYETNESGITYPVFVEQETLPAGTGFWYLNGDSDTDNKTLNW